ncbi:MAG: SLC13 family permease [Magnetovibrionaceae bacterium]
MAELGIATDSMFQMWVTFGVILAALVFYVLEKWPMEVTSVGVIAFLLVFFHLFPVVDETGAAVLDPGRLLEGFGNTALITIMALLVIGQGMVRTGVLDRGAKLVLDLGRGQAWLSFAIVLTFVMAVSAFLNNIPVVVIFIPIMQAVAARFGRSASKVMIPLSFAAVLGGMTTLIGSSTNLLVNSALIGMGENPFGFFDFTVPGLVLAVVGLVYIMLIAPRILPDRQALADSLVPTQGKQFIAQISLTTDSEFVGQKAIGGLFMGLPDMTVRMVQRREQAILPPFEDVVLQPGDVLVVAATRSALTDAMKGDAEALAADSSGGNFAVNDVGDNQSYRAGEGMLAEVMVAPASRLIGRTLPQIGFRYQTRCLVLGLQRRANMIRTRMTDIRLNAGDVMLIQGKREDIEALRNSRDVILLEWSASELPMLDHGKRAGIIMLSVVLAAATGIVPIAVAAVCGAVAMVAAGALNLHQAVRSLDSNIFTMIPAALAMGAALSATGGATSAAHVLVVALDGVSPSVMLSAFFLFTAVLTNVISSKAMAVLFTPIAVTIAIELGVPPEAFAVAVILAANCSFASPLGYETNLLVMGPGHNKFIDFLKAGVPLILIIWIAFSLFAPVYYGLTPLPDTSFSDAMSWWGGSDAASAPAS